MELLVLLGFLTGWFVCWIQMSKSESRKVEQLKSGSHSWMLTSQHWLTQYQRAQELVALQEMEILKASEKVTAQERELDSLRYRT